jgi:nucleolar pre-ribosomal-associated protein 1
LAIRYILTLVKYLHEGGKAELLRNKPLCSNLFHFLKDDPSDVFIEILNNTEQHVLKDTELPRSAKADLLLQHNLERVTEIATRAPENHGAANRAFEWLKAICKKPEYGVLKESGWYPPGTAKTDFDRRPKGFIDLGLDSIDFYDRSDKPVIRNTNTTLLAWIQALRPHSNLQERELVLTCFKSAPELVAAYFAEKPMQLEPKLSNTWIGYASFLFEIVRLPVPVYFGHGEDWAQLPPQIYIMLDSILPRPLTQKVLTRCLNQSSELITFFAVRILLLALEKLAEVRSELAKGAKDPNSESDLWSEASERLSTAFIERCPSMKDVISTFRKLPDDDDHALQQEGITRLLRLFYEILPLQAMEEQFDISTTLTAALVTAENANALSEISQLRLLRLQHLLQIAKNSPGKCSDFCYNTVNDGRRLLVHFWIWAASMNFVRRTGTYGLSIDSLLIGQF